MLKIYNQFSSGRFIAALLLVLIFRLLLAPLVQASPYGVGVYGADVPYGGQTSLTISTDGNVTIPVTPSDAGTLATGTSTVTVTSTDVVGYKLYIRALSDTNLANGGANIPASGNVTAAALAVNTWGYNTDATTNFVGITLSDALIRSRTGPFETGDQTTVTYGVKIDNTKPSGTYSTTVVYTAVPQTQ